MHRSHFALLILSVALCAVSPLQAIQPVEEYAHSDLLLPNSPDAITRTIGQGFAQTPATANEQLEALARRVGGSWRALAWNPVTLTPRLVTGSGVDLGASVTDDVSAERLARRFMELTGHLGDVRADQLALRRTKHGLGKWAVHFTQQMGEFPVIGSRYVVAMTDGGRVVAFGGDLWPRMQMPAHPTLARDAAIAGTHRLLVERGLAPTTRGPWDETTLRQVGILPISATEGRMIYRLEAFYREPLAAWQVDIDAVSGEVLQIQNVLRAIDFSGTISAQVDDPSFCFVQEDFFSKLHTAEVLHVGADTTDENGDYFIPFAGTEAETLHIEMLGPYFNVNNDQGEDALYEELVLPGAGLDLFWDETNSRRDERDVFYHANLAHEFIKWLDPSWTDLDFEMPAIVNISSVCNAYYYMGTINFFHEDLEVGCANTGTIGDIIHHEYGHGITDYMYGENDPPDDLHEANSDVIGNYLTNDSQMGRGFYLDCEAGIRDSDNDLRYPDDLTGQGHHDGQILAGFHWDIRTNLIARLGEEAGHQHAAQIWHFARALGLPVNQPEQVWWTFIADDDDGNLDSGTPNWIDICPAAQRHGFTCPEAFENVVIHHMPYVYAASPGGAEIMLEAEIYSLDCAVNPDSLLIYYRGMGAMTFEIALMEPTGEENVYAGNLPGYPVGTWIQYYIFAADEEQNTLTDPRQAPAELNQFMVVSVYESFEAEHDWTVGAPGDNATQGIWEWCDPVGIVLGPYDLQPEDDTTPEPGHLCWITEQYDGGYPWFSDADGQTTLQSPIYDLTGADYFFVRFQRWFQTTGTGDGIMEVDVTEDGGDRWITIDHVAGNDPDAAWQEIQADLTDLITSLDQVQFRVVMYGLPNPSIEDGGIDDFTIIAGMGMSGIENGETAARLHLSLETRNLASGPITIHYSLAQAGAVNLSVHDLNGRLVRRLVQGSSTAGEHAITWDGRDGIGAQVGSGVYFIRLNAPTGGRSRRLIMAR